MESREIDSGIAAHARWKYRLFSAIETGTSEWTVADIREYTKCQFGQWLTSLSATERASEQCVKVTELHEAFHRAAADVLEMALSDRRAEAEEAIALGSPFSLVSANLTEAMSVWKEVAC